MAWKSFMGVFKIFCIAVGIFLIVSFAYFRWTPGLTITDGCHDLKKNAIWLQHGWLGDDQWFIKNGKKIRIKYFRNPEEIRRLASLLRQHNITDVFPHLCPTSSSGEISSVDPKQTELFLKVFDGFRVMPWVGGVLGQQAHPQKPQWRRNFAESIRILLTVHPEFSGVHINIEPCSSGDKDFLLLLDEVRNSLPAGKMLSVAAFPPPTILHPFNEVHWDKDYYREISKRVDQVVVMMYDTSLDFEKVYQSLTARWTREVLDWSEGVELLLGVPAYEEKNVGYHKSRVENLKNALSGIHSGLSKYETLPKNYQGIALYCEWQMDDSKYELLRTHFLKGTNRTENKNNSIITALAVGGHLIPYSKSGSGPAMVLRDVSGDESYGYTTSKPIKVGGDSENKGPMREDLYLQALYGPNGEPIEYQRLGSCCPFKTTKGIFGRGLLDVYSIKYKGHENSIKLYVNMYEYSEPKAPYGFSLKR